jgi:hypothetical protein
MVRSHPERAAAEATHRICGTISRASGQHQFISGRNPEPGGGKKKDSSFSEEKEAKRLLQICD